MSARPGISLVEAVAALTAGAFVCAGMATLFQAEQRLAASRAARLTRSETARVAVGLLRSELASLVPAQDVAGVARDTLAIRLFRGLAVTCTSPGGDSAVLVRFQGARDPDPAKDSILLFPEGRVVPLTASTPGRATCPGSGSLLQWRMPAPPARGATLLLFERGVYALSGAALRLRRGREGRQPLTAEVLRDAGSGFTPLSRAPGLPPRAIGVALSFQRPAVTRRARVQFLAPDSTDWP